MSIFRYKILGFTHNINGEFMSKMVDNIKGNFGYEKKTEKDKILKDYNKTTRYE